jgi:hypothetical protein
MKPYPPEPLSPEERELAQLTARLGPQGEPSPALDARVLAAAQAALRLARAAGSPRHKPRWPVALGLAASMVLAVGIAWQLRPLQSSPEIVASEAPAPAQPVADAQAPSAMAATPMREEAESAAVADVMEAPAEPATPAETVAKSAPRPAAPPPPAPVLADRGAVVPDDARARSGQRAAKPAIAADSAVVVQTRTTDRYQPPAPPAPPAPVAMPAPTFAEEPSIAFAPAPLEEVTLHRESADTSTSAAAGNARAYFRNAAARETSAKAGAANAQARENATLDRIEVTGTRLKRTDLQVPVSDDAQLPVNEWLERVRTRYGLGDAGAAKRSLLLFVKDHPGEPVPDDLEPLLEK